MVFEWIVDGFRMDFGWAFAWVLDGLGWIWDGFQIDFGWFGTDFGWVLDGFWMVQDRFWVDGFRYIFDVGFLIKSTT